MVEFRQNPLSQDEILNYMNENEEIFIPKLASRLNVKEYSLKLHKYATHFCAYDNNRLIGLIACYFNDKINQTGFISSASVNKKYQGMGISSTLLNQVISYGKQNKFNKIKLEVRIENKSIVHFYERAGFLEIPKNRNNIIEMELNLKS